MCETDTDVSDAYLLWIQTEETVCIPVGFLEYAAGSNTCMQQVSNGFFTRIFTE